MMYSYLVRLMLLGAAIQFGVDFWAVVSGDGLTRAKLIDGYARRVLHVDWKPISVWPEEARRFR